MPLSIESIKSIVPAPARKRIMRYYRAAMWELAGIIHRVHFKSFTKHASFNVLDDEETINQILNNHVSMARFGDGEFGIIKNLGNGFQNPDSRLRDRLIEVLNSNESTCMVCLPRPLLYQKGLNRYAKNFWNYFIKKHGDFILTIIPQQKTFGDSNCTRYYMDFVDKKHANAVIQQFRKVWDNRDICIIEGANSRLGCGNDLFDNAKSIKRIICPPTNAFEKYDSIIASVKSNTNKGQLLLLALGMTATVLAYDLSKIGYQALDVGHIDIEYEWYLMNATSKVPVTGKAVNECNTNHLLETINDILYTESIIDKVL